MNEKKRHLAAIMFTDVVGYSALSQKDEVLALELLEEHRSLLRPLFTKHEGTEIKTMGDAFLVEFGSVVESVMCAVEMQSALRSRNALCPKGRRIEIRIGLHLGDIFHQEGDVYGDGVNIASRIEPLADPGGICVSRQFYDQIYNKIEEPIVYEGKHQLKNIATPVETYKVMLPWHKERAGSSALEDQGGGKSIVVLPFVDMSQGKDQEYFCDGMAEELIDALCKVSELRVVARTSAFAFKGERMDVREIGKKLNVETVLEGSVRKAANRLRITAQLVNVADGYHLWSEKYDREMQDIFAIQDEISLAIVGELKVKLLGEEKERLTKRHTEDLEAHSLYLKGRHTWRMAQNKKAVEYYRQAVEKDPLYALPYVGMAESLSWLSWDISAPKEIFPKAKEAITKALGIDDTLCEAQMLLGWINMHYDWDWPAAESHFERAIELNPNYSTGRQRYARYLCVEERFDEAIAEAKRAKVLDPVFAFTGHIYNAAGLYDEAIEDCRKYLELSLSRYIGLVILGWSYTYKEMYEEAIATFQEVLTLRADDTATLGRLGLAYALSGQREEALIMLKRLNEQSKERYIPHFYRALINVGLGTMDEAFEHFKEAILAREPRLVWYIPNFRQHSIFQNLTSDPRYRELRKKLNLSD